MVKKEKAKAHARVFLLAVALSLPSFGAAFIIYLFLLAFDCVKSSNSDSIIMDIAQYREDENV